MLAYLLLALLIFPSSPVNGMSFELAYAQVGDSLISLEGHRVGSVYVTPLGNATIEQEKFRHLSFNATTNATRFFKIHGSYERYEIREVGGSWDVVFFIGDRVVFFNTNHELHCNGTHVRFEASSFEVVVGEYGNAIISRPAIVLLIALISLVIARKLFPTRSG